NFKNDLDADSLDIFEIINEIEDEFDVKIETDESIETVADLVNFITEKTEA
ncbi:MAG TPA: acyl carrier protein, partial [Lactobacillus sp.]|nr:acyl carrier protein [Lactobacillus sp.]